MHLDLIINKFKTEDFPTYLAWFKDPELNKRLGPMKEDDEWLEYILQEIDGATYSVFRDKLLVAVIGIVLPSKEYPHFTITNIAVNPAWRNQGLGTAALKKVMDVHTLKKGEYWLAYVDEKNPRAKSFFERNGWTFPRKTPEKTGMFLCEYGKE